MNITHYCSKCDRFHTDVPCVKAAGYKIYPCPTCDKSPCRCPDYGAYLANDVEAHEVELRRVQAALDWYKERTKPKFTDAFSALDVELFRRALGVLL